MKRFASLVVFGIVLGCGGGGGDDAGIDGAMSDAGRDGAAADTGAPDARPDLSCTTDADGDGHVALACGGDDCDDADPHRFPGNPETCDAHDEDCNPATLGPDGDMDGYPATTCCNPQPGGAPLCGTDCNDASPDIRPTAPESCNGVDDNCNGMVDEGVINTYYADCDGDGYGIATGSMTGCTAPTVPPTCGTAGHIWVTAGGDCDDASAAVHPTAAEACNGVDDDCNGTVDDEPAADASCNVHGTGATCASGTCSAATCTGGYLDCDPASPGCETDPMTSAANCGSCAHACAHPTCTAGTCADDFVQIGAGNGLTCGVRASGAVACWGWNGAGQVGDGTTTERHTPTAVSGITDATQVAVGQFNHACTLHLDGTVSCWGGNTWGYLGDGTTTSRTTPVAVTGLANVTQLSASADHTCAVHDGGLVACWGSGSQGQLGDGTTMDRYTPVDAMGIVDATWVGAGGNFTCALHTGGTISCWGRGIEGEMGDGATGAAAGSLVPVLAAGGLTAASLAVGYGHVCGFATGLPVGCWGADAFGQLGNGASGTNSGSPVLVTGMGLISPVALTAGKYHTCLRHGSGGGALTCWGANDHGQLGDGTTTMRTTSTPVFGIGSVAEVTAGVSHTCVRQTTNVVQCFGSNANGELGDGTTTPRDAAAPITDP